MTSQRKLKAFVIAGLVVAMIISVCFSKSLQKEDEKKLSIGENFHYQTSITEQGVIGDMLREKPKKPLQYKTYQGAKSVKLPQAKYRGITVEEAIENRRSVRSYSAKAITMQQLSQLLFAAQGITAKLNDQPLRSAPSAGALYPFELYVAVNNVQDLPQGIYHYAVQDHSLELIKAGDFRKQITSAGLGQEMLGDAAVTIVLSAIFDRVCFRYGQRGYRYVYIETGHIGQNISLEAVSLGLGSVSVGAFLDEQVNQLIGADGQKEAAIYLQAVGRV